MNSPEAGLATRTDHLMNREEFVEARGATPDLPTTGLFHDLPNKESTVAGSPCAPWPRMYVDNHIIATSTNLPMVSSSRTGCDSRLHIDICVCGIYPVRLR